MLTERYEIMAVFDEIDELLWAYAEIRISCLINIFTRRNEGGGKEQAPHTQP